MDKVKEALFNIIGRNIYGAVFLDLLAGTGSVGIEALSRGAAKAVFVDLERKAIQTIQDNLTATKFSEKAIVKRADALKIVSQAPSEHFDFVYIAPPQYKKLWLDVMQALDSHKTPPQNTKLGGDIYIHGNGAGSDWTWGCVALENDDIRELFNSVTVGTPVTIKP